jgi:putative glutathione S-transferase
MQFCRHSILRSLTTSFRGARISSMSASASGTQQGLVQGAAGVTTDDQTNATQRRAAGEFVRGVSTARNWIQDADVDSDSLYPVEDGRYHLYVAYNCPWCHRVLLGLAVMGLQDCVTVNVCFPNRSSDDEPLGGNLWKFSPQGQTGTNGKHTQFPSCTIDTVNGKTYVKEIYELAGIDDQKSVPVLFCKKTNTVVSNESAEILRMFGTVFQKYAKHAGVDLYPGSKAVEIDELNDWIYKDIANGSYKAGFSSSQETYETAYATFFAALDRLNVILSKSEFLVGDNVTEADLRLFPATFRFDPVYHNRFKLNKKFLWDYPHIWRWMGDMMKLPGMEAVSNAEYLQHCKQGYFGRTGNGTVPIGPLGYPECFKEPHWSHQK